MNNNIYSQENIKTEFYYVKKPEKTIIKAFNSTHEEFANIDAYQFITDEKPKYILYLMSNRINIEITSINIDNFKDFLSDDIFQKEIDTLVNNIVEIKSNW